LAFRQARGNRRIARDRTSASGTVGDRHSDAVVAGTSLADILRATETGVVDLGVLRSVAKTAGIGRILGTLTRGVTSQRVATLVGRSVDAEHSALFVELGCIDLLFAGAQVIQIRGTAVETEVAHAVVLGGTVGLAPRGNVVEGNIGCIHAHTGLALRGGAVGGSWGIGSAKAVELAFRERRTVDTIAGCVAKLRSANIGGTSSGASSVNAKRGGTGTTTTQGTAALLEAIRIVGDPGSAACAGQEAKGAYTIATGLGRARCSERVEQGGREVTNANSILAGGCVLAVPARITSAGEAFLERNGGRVFAASS